MLYEHYRDRSEYFHFGRNRTNSAHFHRSIEFIYCISESKVIYIEGQQYILKQGELLMLPPFTVHHFPFIETQRSLCVVMPVGYSDLYKTAVGTKRFASPIITDKDMAKEVYEHLLKLEHTENNFLRDGIYRYIIGFLVEHGELVESTEKSKDSFAFTVLTHLENHYSEKLSLETVASALGYNRCYFSTVFKKIFHAGFCEYLAMMRVEKSLELLLGERPINEVAYEVGFGSLQSYYTSFKKVKGMSPAAYRAEKKA